MLPPLPAEDWDDAARDALASVVPPERRDADGVGNALGVLVRHPNWRATSCSSTTTCSVIHCCPSASGSW